jgi:hypothetical protein
MFVSDKILDCSAQTRTTFELLQDVVDLLSLMSQIDFQGTVVGMHYGER